MSHVVCGVTRVGECFANLLFLSLFYGVSFQAEEEEEDDQPLSLSWPDTNRKRLTYLLIIPIVLPLWITLPDVRKAVCDAEFSFLKAFHTRMPSALDE